MIRKNFSKVLMISAMTLVIAPQFAWGFCFGSDDFCGTSGEKKGTPEFHNSDVTVSQGGATKTVHLRVQKRDDKWKQDYAEIAAKCVLNRIQAKCPRVRDIALDKIKGISIAAHDISDIKISSSSADKLHNLKILLRFDNFAHQCKDYDDGKCSEQTFCDLVSEDLRRFDAVLFDGASCVAPIGEADGVVQSDGSLHPGPQ